MLSRSWHSRLFSFLTGLLSEVWLVTTFVEVRQEAGFILELYIFVIRVAHITRYRCVTSTLRGDLVQDYRAPYVTLLDVVKSLVAGSHEVVNLFSLSNFVVLAPVVSKLQLGGLWSGVLSVAVPSNNKGHVSTVLSE